VVDTSLLQPPTDLSTNHPVVSAVSHSAYTLYCSDTCTVDENLTWFPLTCLIQIHAISMIQADGQFRSNQLIQTTNQKPTTRMVGIFFTCYCHKPMQHAVSRNVFLETLGHKQTSGHCKRKPTQLSNLSRLQLVTFSGVF